MKKLIICSITAALCGTFATAQQIGCQTTTSSLVGPYTFIATELPVSGVVFTPPGSAGNSQIFSKTPTGTLISSINSGGPFSQTGVLYLDGGGHVGVAPVTAPMTPSTNIGTYSVNPDCTINMTLTDVFNTTTSGPGVTNPTLGTANLIGLALSGGSEIDLSVAQSSTSTNGNTPIVNGQFASRLSIRLIRTFTAGCNASNLTGAYGLVGQGFALTTPSTSTGTGTGTGTTTSGVAQPASFLARLRFDGNGNIVSDTVVSPSPLASFQYVGTYTVNADCSGSMTLSNVPAAGTTPPAVTSANSLTLSFVVIPPIAFVANGTTTLVGNAGRPSLLFTVTSPAETVFGYGDAQ